MTRAVLEFVASVPALMEQHRAAFLQIYTDKVASYSFPHTAFQQICPGDLLNLSLILPLASTLPLRNLWARDPMLVNMHLPGLEYWDQSTQKTWYVP